jgi:hypothetical protein
MAIIRCCKDCTDRHYGCHSKCEKYNAEKKAMERKYVASDWEAEEYYRRQWTKRRYRRINDMRRGRNG